MGNAHNRERYVSARIATAMLYVPLRTVITSRGGDVSHFSIEQPSSLLSSFGSEEITVVGIELDRKVARLLEHLEVPVPPAFAPS